MRAGRFGREVRLQLFPGGIAHQARGAERAGHLLHAENEVHFAAQEAFLTHRHHAADHDRAEMQDHAEARLCLGLQAVERRQRACDAGGGAVAVVPVGQETIAEEFVDAPAARFDDLFALGQPASGDDRHFLCGQRVTELRQGGNVRDEQPARRGLDVLDRLFRRVVVCRS